MINKQQIEIEEMKNILLNSGAVTFEENVQKLYRQFHKDEFYVSNNEGHLTIDYSKFATALYNKNYRQVPKNAVILTQEEYDRMFSFKGTQGGFFNILDTVREIQSQETAKDFLFKVESYLGYNADNETFTKKELLLILAEVAKEQYGVEVGNDQ